LEANEDRLGGLVESLEGVAKSVSAMIRATLLERADSTGNILISLFSRIDEIEVRMLEACTNLVEVELASSSNFVELLHLWQPPNHSLTTLSLCDYRCRDDEINNILFSKSLETVRHLKLCDVKLDGPNSALSYPLESLYAQKTELRWIVSLDLRLLDLSRFRKLHVDGYVENIEPLLTSVSSVLQHLTISVPTPDELSSQFRSVGKHQIPDTFRSVVSPHSCETLPKLTSFTLHNFHGPLLEFLLALSISSHSLSTINLSRSQWLESDEDQALSPSGGSQNRLPSIPVEDVKKVLKKFTRLERIDFGKVSGGEAFDSLVRELKMRGVRVGWDH
jgi:hypothetical protein